LCKKREREREKKKKNNQYKVTGYMKPGVGVVLLMDTVKYEISKFTKEDMLIFWGWANYIAHNASSKGLNQSSNTDGKSTH